MAQAIGNSDFGNCSPAHSFTPAATQGGDDDDDDDNEIFEDAEDVTSSSEMELSVSLREARVALELFLDNRFEEAIKRMKPWSDSSMYHSLAHTTLLFLQAVLSFEKPAIEEAISSVKKSISIAHSMRKKDTVLQTLQKMSLKETNYSKYTDMEIHAELVYAETLLIRALLSFVQDENLISFIKGALKIKSCYQSYKECRKLVEVRDKTTLADFEHFSSGVNMGVGAFNLLISQLPSRVLKLLEFVGFSGNRGRGLQELKLGSEKLNSLRGPLCSLILLAYHTLIVYILGTGEGDIELSEEILKPGLKEFPNSALFLFFAGRLEEIKGNIDEGIKLLLKSVDSQSEWRQFHHICYWELMWSYAYKADWLFAMKYAETLANENKWSRATYIYLKASFLSLCDKSAKTAQLVNDLYCQVPSLLQKIAGKSLPIEKFALQKVKLYKAQGNWLTLAALEMTYVWNGFAIISRKPSLLDTFIPIIEESINQLVAQKGEMKYFYDNYSLALLLKGVCLGSRGHDFQADMCYQEIIQHGDELKFDTYLVPWAVTEQALLRIKAGKYEEAGKLLERAKNKYKGYALESRLHFKIHAANNTLRQASVNESSSSSF